MHVQSQCRHNSNSIEDNRYVLRILLDFDFLSVFPRYDFRRVFTRHRPCLWLFAACCFHCIDAVSTGSQDSQPKSYQWPTHQPTDRPSDCKTITLFDNRYNAIELSAKWNQPETMHIAHLNNCHFKFTVHLTSTFLEYQLYLADHQTSSKVNKFKAIGWCAVFVQGIIHNNWCFEEPIRSLAGIVRSFR